MLRETYKDGILPMEQLATNTMAVYASWKKRLDYVEKLIEQAESSQQTFADKE